MTRQTIQSEDISVAGIFQQFYVVPDYQREYVWVTEQVERLLSDINGEFSGESPQNAPEYFIGSIVVCPSSDGVLELIDGQQRMTTLYLTLCAIRDRMVEIEATPPGSIEGQIEAVSTDAFGVDHFRYRLDLQYEDSGDVLTYFARGYQFNDEMARNTRSIYNICNAYSVIKMFLMREFGDSADQIRQFYGYLSNRVKLIRIETANVAKALKIFETINDRGVGLNSMDLLKNLLFMKTERNQFDKLKSIWKELQDVIYDMSEKPLRFLRYFIFSTYDVDILREDAIYTWLADREEICGYGKDPLGFAEELLAAAKAYRNFINGRDVSGNANAYLDNMRLLGGGAARQHLILLLAGRHLNASLFEKLCREVENLFFAYVVTREPTRDFERNFAKWAGEIRKIGTAEELNKVISDRFRPAREELSARFDDAMRRLTGDALQQYRLRYVLGKLSQDVDQQAYGETQRTKWLSRYTGKDFEIEHIFPQNPREDTQEEFGEYYDEEITQRLGNLVLVERSINASLGNQPYSAKRKIYQQSQLLLTRALSEKPKVGSNTKIDIAVKELETFDTWDEDAVLRRQSLLASMARRIWDIPSPSSDPY